MQNYYRYFLFISFLFFTAFSYSQTDSANYQHLETVVVTGQYSPQTLKKSVYQVRVINHEAIELTGATSVQQVLNTQLGFRFTNDNALGISDLKLNGMGGNNVKILLDGVPMADRYDQRVSLSQIDIHNIERIEIVEGPMSVSYGSDAMAGVINIITKKQSGNNLSLDASAREETVGNEYYPFSYKGVHNQNIQLNYKKKHFLFAAGGTHNDFDGSGGDAYGRGKTWKPKEQWFGNARLGYASEHFNIYYRIDGVHELIKARNPINMNNYKAVDQEFLTGRYIHQVQGSYRINSKIHFNSFLAYTHYRRQTKTIRHNFEDNTIEPNQAGEEDLSGLNNLSFKTTVQYEVSPILSLQPGIDINHEKASGDRIEGSPAINDLALFASAEIKPVATIKIRPGFRFSSNSQYNAPVITPAVNTKFELNKQWDLRLAYGYGFRAPTLRELYLTFFDANHSLIGNTNLKAEHSHSINGSITFAPEFANAVTFKSVLSGFYNQYSNQIQLVQSVTNDQEYTYYNIDRSNTAGGGIENQLNMKNLRITVGFAYTGYSSEQFENKDYIKEDNREYLWTPEISSDLVYNIPKIKTKLGLYYKFAGKKPSFSFGTINNEDAILLNHTASYSLADFSLATEVHKYFTVNAGVKNIFDVTNVANTVITSGTHSGSGPLSIAYGRSYFIGLAFHWKNN